MGTNVLRGITVAALLACSTPALGSASSQSAAIEQARAGRERLILDEFLTLLAIPNVSADRADLRRNAEAIGTMLRRRDLAPQFLRPASDPGAAPVIYAELKSPNAKRTLVLYAHYDGQPVEVADWSSPPFSPTLRLGPDNIGPALRRARAGRLDPETRVYARGAGDDKAGVMVILAALDVLGELRRAPTDNVKIVFEGEEEAGSPHLAETLAAHRNLFAGADLWVVCDGPAHPSGRPLIVYGARGDINIDLTVYGPNHPLHSGHFGNWAPNPALRLAQLLAAMKDDKGHVAVPGWYDGIAPLGDRERHAIAAAAQFDSPIQASLGLAATESDLSLAASATEPSLNIKGLRSAEVGAGAANIIPDIATAALDVRLVAGEDPGRQFERLAAFVRGQGYLVLDRPPTPEERLAHPLIATLELRPGGYGAARAPMDDPLARAVAEAVVRASPQPPVELPTSGASLPLSVIADALGTRGIVVSIANSDDNQHAANENLRLANLWTGVDLYTALLLHEPLP
jgi:acetylornithine deacetylase/succinyl-diaminopimelate desuccinylase-like protein